MMQSILLPSTNAPKATDNPNNVEVDGATEDLEASKNSKDFFSDVLDELSKESETENETLLAMDESVEKEGETPEIASDLLSIEITPSENTLKNTTDTKVGNEIKVDTEEGELLQATGAENELAKKDGSVLDKIEMALLIDTRVTDFKSGDPSKVDPKIDSLNNIKEKNKLGNEALKNSPLKGELLKNDSTINTDLKSLEPVATKENQLSPSMMPLAEVKTAESNSSTLSSNSGNDSLTSKEISFTNLKESANIKLTELSTKIVQNSSLQQPLELQSKQAATILSDRILMMLNQSKQEVTIRLDPAELGSMHVKVQINNDQLQLSIQAQTGQTKDLLEQNLSRLKDQLAEQGINLSEANIEQQSPKNQGDKNAGSQLPAINEEADQLQSENQDDIPLWLNSEITGSDKKVDYYA